MNTSAKKPSSKEGEDRVVDDGKIEVRSSSLGMVASCLRHAMASRYEQTARRAHEDIPPESGRYKLHAGTALHKAMEDNVSDDAALDEIVEEAFNRYLNDDDLFDEKFTNLDDIAKIVKAMVHAFRASPHSREWTTEREGNLYEPEVYSDQIDPDYRLTGHIDCVRKDGRILDLKTGATTPSPLHQKQLASYHLLVKHGLDRDSHLKADVVKVGRPRSPNFRTINIARFEVDIEPHIKTIPLLVKKAGDAISDHSQWQEDFTRLPANPNCVSCAYCKLFNTSACPETRHRSLDAGPSNAD